MKKILFTLCLFINSVSFGQNILLPKWCKVGDYVPPTGGDLVNNKNPLNSNSLLIDPNGVIIIPVVFHVLYNLSQPSAENIPVALINSQIERLNTDFNLQNPDVSQVPGPWSNLPSNIKIQFKLACVDPQGNSTDGIKRIATTNYSFLQSNFYDAKRTAYGGDDAWPTDTYLNIWTCNMEAYWGHAMFPWEYNGSTNGIPHNLLDGIVLHYEVVGDNNSHATMNKGRVAVHEVGHWLGLWHIHNNGCYGLGDEVNDTPPQENGNYNTCPTFPQLGTICSTQYPGHMFMNYMDGTTDVCKYMFTMGQKDRMRSYFAQNGPTGTRFPFIQNYFGIKRFPSIPPNPYIVQNNTITVFINNPACIPVSYTYTGPVTLVGRYNDRVVFSVNCGVSGNLSVTANAANYTDTYAFDFVNSGQSPVSISPAGPIDYYFFWEQGGAIGVKLSSNSTTGNQWYKNGVQILNATQQTFVAHVGGNYSVAVNNCFSNIVVINTHTYGYSGSMLGEQIFPVQTPEYYCINTTEIIKQFDLGPTANYTWDTNPFSLPTPVLQIEPTSYNINSPNALVNVGNTASGSPSLIQGIADLNGVQKVFDYLLRISPFIIQPFQLCQNFTYSFYSWYNTTPYTLPGGTKFDFETYDFRPNGVIVSPAIYAGLQQITIPGNSPLSGPLQVQFSNNSSINYHFYYNWGGCYEINIPVQIVCFSSGSNSKNRIAIYPNPAANQITISSQDDIHYIEISDLMNPALKRIKVNNTKSVTVNVFDLKPGIYNCRITTDKGAENQKLIINK